MLLKNFKPEQYAFPSGMEILHTNKEKVFYHENYPKADKCPIDYAILEPSKIFFVLLLLSIGMNLWYCGVLYDKLDKDDNNNALVNCQVWPRMPKGNIIRPKVK